MKTRSSILLLAALIGVAPAASAKGSRHQERAQKGEKNIYLPEKGDFSVGVDMIPLLKTIGGAFTSSSETPVGGNPFDYSEMYIKPNVSIMGRYMITDNWAFKANLGLSLNHNYYRAYAPDDLKLYLDPNSDAKVIDMEKGTRFGGTLMAGAEYRLGKRRVQGVFGAGLLLGLSTSDVKYTYGNEITSVNQTPSATITPSVPVAIPAGYRVTSFNAEGPNVTLGAYLSAGAEWFVAPKISLGAEVDLFVYTTMSSQGYVKSQGWNEAYRQVENRTDLYTPGSNNTVFGTDNLGGSFYVSFYF